MTYTKRTCVECGIRRPQPEMYHQEIIVQTGNSKTGVSGMTFTGAILGHKKSRRSVGSWLFNAGQRSYNRKRKVWICSDCNRRANPGIISKTFGLMISFIFILITFWGGIQLLALIDGMK